MEGAEKYGVYLIEDGVAKALTTDLTETEYVMTGMTNGEFHTFLVHAYINGKWTDYTEEDYVYTAASGKLDEECSKNVEVFAGFVENYNNISWTSIHIPSKNYHGYDPSTATHEACDLRATDIINI